MGFISWFTNNCSILVKQKIFNCIDIYFILIYRAQINILIGFVTLAWIIAPAAYYSNLWGSKAMPIVSNRVFTAEGYFYNVTAVLDSKLRLNETLYKHYGMLIYEMIMIFSNLI